MAWTRRIALAAALCGAMAVLPGCTVPVAGMTGVSVTEDGQPLGVMLVCHGHTDVAVLSTDRGRPGDGGLELGTWTRTEGLTGYSTWPLSGTGGDGWSTPKPLAPLVPGQEYTLFGGTKGNSWSVMDVHFSADDLATLAPGQVIHFDVSGESADADGQVTTSVGQFRAEVCSDGPVAGRQVSHGTRHPPPLTRR
ncbi:hypothetical protein ACFVT5_23385 [Streptomyces sp. NPDC058001]|uniref:hypothetical protein n=1 Tax=Streptomyces sp. NPDC058001 TaxID=3346300 RepID=UPI0036ED19B7